MAEEQDKEQKTEPPSGKRIGEARERGELPISQEMGSWGMLMAILVVVAFLGPPMARQMVGSLRVFLEKPEQIDLAGPGLQTALIEVTLGIALATGFVFLLLSAAAVLTTMIQTSFYMSPAKLKWDIARLNPMGGIKKLLSMQSLVELLKSIIKLVVLGTVAFYIFRGMINELPGYVGYDLVNVVKVMHGDALHLIIVFMFIVTVMSVGDLIYTRFTYFKNLRMTKQEVKDEYKQMEGDPHIRGRLKQMRLEKARRRMLAAVPKADVIITNPTHYAVALKYDGSKMAAPVLLAKGIDKVAERIRDVASEHEIPLVSNPPLARTLYDTVELDEPIKPEQYRAVAEVISYVYKLKKKQF